MNSTRLVGLSDSIGKFRGVLVGAKMELEENRG